MCLILFTLNDNPKYKLILAANRDEFYDRSSLSADFWKENNSILSGKDVKSGGTWLGATKNGRFIAITNYRDPKVENKNALSRGEISKTFLTENISVSDFIKKISTKRDRYNGFNLLLSDDAFESFYYYSNVTDKLEKITSGQHGLSNHLLDSSWPKVESAKNNLKLISKSDDIDSEKLVEMLADNNEAPENLLPKTGISLELEKKLSPVFISMKGYGTRCSTVLTVTKNNKLFFLEVTYNENQQILTKKQFDFKLKC